MTLEELPNPDCRRCAGEGVIPRYRRVRCCYPKPLSMIECGCGYNGGFDYEEIGDQPCPNCMGGPDPEIEEDE